MRTAKARVAVFLIFLAPLSIAVDLLSSRGVFGNVGSLAYMWCPAGAAVVASLITRRSFKAFGWRPRLKYMAAGWLIPIACGFFAYGVVWLTGLGDVPKSTFLERARMNLNLSAARPNWLVIVAAFFFITIPLLLPSLISAFGEELGWRGFLVPELNDWLGFRGACLVSGVVWTLWHLPPILFRGYGVSGTPKIYQVACFAVMVVSSAVVLAWLRMRSGSVWPAAIMHATHNAAIQLFFDPITAHKACTQYFVGEFGIGLAVPLALLAWFCVRNYSRGNAISGHGQPRWTPFTPRPETS